MLPRRLADPFWQIAKQYWTNPNDNRRSTDFIVVHHAAAEYPPGRALQLIYDYHKGKWPTYHAAGYHEIIQLETDGSLRAHQMNPDNIVAAGVMNRNANTYHICAARNLSNEIPSQLWIDAIARRVTAAKQRYPKAQIVGHKELALPGFETICPGNKWAAWKPTLLAQVASMLAQQPPAVPRYRMKRVGVHHLRDCSDPPFAYLDLSTEYGIDEVYPDGKAHLASGLGFLKSLDGLEKV